MPDPSNIRAQVHNFLVARRSRLTPEAAGLTVGGGNRRVPGLRREELAVPAGISVDYVVRLERGDRSGVKRLRHSLVGELNLPYESLYLSADVGLSIACPRSLGVLHIARGRSSAAPHRGSGRLCTKGPVPCSTRTDIR